MKKILLLLPFLMFALVSGCVPIPAAPAQAPQQTLWCSGLPRPATAETVQYAAQKSWYTNSGAMSVFSDRYVQFGLPITPRMLASGNPPITFERVGEYDGVPMYVRLSDRDQMPHPRFIYLLLNPECHLIMFAKAEEVR